MEITLSLISRCPKDPNTPSVSIYNALESANVLAKLDGNDELCEMIVLLSACFRQNAETMRQRFVTVKRKFRSLTQYVEMHRHFYGDTFQADFRIGEGVAGAYLPTMIIQPLLENALAHGVSGMQPNQLLISADARDRQLLVRIQDDGPDMTEDTIRRILTPPAEGSQAYSEPKVDTCVEVCMPLSYDSRPDVFFRQNEK